jgi:hypothetical protein
MTTPIHFIGIKPTIDALSNIPYEGGWCLWQGKQVTVSGDDLDNLEDWLTRLQPAGSTGAYTVRLYNDPGPYEYTTPYKCSFNISLVDRYAGQGVAGYNNSLAQEIADLKKKMAESDNEAEPESIGDVILGWCKDPAQLDIVAGVIGKIMGRAPVQQLQIPQTVGSTNPAAQETDNDRLLRLSKVLDNLEKRDPKLLEHLEKLSAQDDLTLQIILSKLNSL